MPVVSGEKPEGKNEELTGYESLVTLLGDRVRSVIQGFQVGAYISGRAGTGKTFVVRSSLEESRRAYAYVNARITPAAMFDLIEENADAVIVLDDVPLLFANPQGAQILMAAAGDEACKGRPVSYMTKNSRRTTVFRGALIAISNLPLSHDPAGQALASRLTPHFFDPSDAMVHAFLQFRAAAGMRGVTARECGDVLGHVIDVCRQADYRLDLRHFFKAVGDYEFWKSGGCRTHWRILVEASMRRLSSPVPCTPLSRSETKAREQDIARELHSRQLPADELARAWEQQTGKSMDTYYRRKRELRLK